MNQKFKISSKILSYFRRLEIMYRSNKETLLHEIILNSSIFVEEDVPCWEFVAHGHNIILFLDENTIEKINSFELQKKLCSTIKNDLKNLTTHITNEGINSVVIELADHDNLDYKSSIRLSSQSIDNPDNLNIWTPGCIRLFISHRDEFKKEATCLAQMLKAYGISSFVAHDSIEPLEKWQNTIIKALHSMEIMIVFVTDDFFKSCWTNQEIGFALGKNVPIISLKLQQEPPQGFIQETQAIICKLDLNADSLKKIFEILSKKLNYEERFRRCLIRNFVEASSFNEAEKTFEQLQSLQTIDNCEAKQIIEGFNYNWQIRGARDVNPKFINFLQNKTGKYYQLKDDQIVIDDVDEKEKIGI